MNKLSLIALTALAFAQATPVFAQTAEPKPLPALVSPKATQGLLLGLAAAGTSRIAVGGNGVILRAVDGKDFKQVASPVDSTLTGLAFADASDGWAVGHDGAILHSADGGATWALQNWQPEQNAPLFAVLPLSAQEIITVGAFGTIKTSADGGKTWVDVDAPTITGEKNHLNAIARLHDGRMAVVGERGLVGLSSDGREWQRIALPYEGSLFGVLPLGERGAAVFGMRGNVYVSDAPETGQWTKVETGTTSSLFAGALLGEDIILVGADGAILRISGSQRKTSVINVKGMNRDQVFAAIQMNSNLMIVGGDKGVLKLTLPRQ
ncbi:MAG: YCF48-related protein [Stagnimonas sp.]|nr:YCF48-related protein [Stagnimonas sp.]